MPPCVIDLLETIEIEKYQCERIIPATTIVQDAACKTGMKPTAIGKTGELVDLGLGA